MGRAKPGTIVQTPLNRECPATHVHTPSIHRAPRSAHGFTLEQSDVANAVITHCSPTIV